MNEQLLCYRNLSELSGVSLGSIAWVLNDLSEGGYVAVASDGKRRWLDKPALIQRWVAII